MAVTRLSTPQLELLVQLARAALDGAALNVPLNDEQTLDALIRRGLARRVPGVPQTSGCGFAEITAEGLRGLEPSVNGDNQ